MNNDNINNTNGRKKPFEVHIEDDGFLSPETLESIKPVDKTPKKKFEVHIDEDAVIPEVDDHTPEYKGEVYFSNRKPQKKISQPVQPSSVMKKQPETKKTSGNKAFNSVLAIFLAVVLIFTTTFSAIAITCINDVLALNRSEELVKVTIPKDSTTDSIIDILSDEGLIKQKIFCKLYYNLVTFLKNLNKDPKPGAPEYLSGVYYVQKNLGLEGYLNKFMEVQKTADTINLVFPEGWTIYQMFDKIAEFGVCSKQELLDSLNGTEFENDFVKDIPQNENRTFALEGYFYPATYEFYEKSDANSIIRKFLEASEDKWTEEYEARRIELGMTRDEVITVASIIQREAASKKQMGLVSSVIHNRLDNSVSWPLLGCDSTTNYISSYVAPNVSSSLAMTYENAYDTYSQQGLPPGPICNPGDDAIKAALYPEDTNYFYFRHDKYGEIYMARTQAEHDANGREVLRVNSR